MAPLVHRLPGSGRDRDPLDLVDDDRDPGAAVAAKAEPARRRAIESLIAAALR